MLAFSAHLFLMDTCPFLRYFSFQGHPGGICTCRQQGHLHLDWLFTSAAPTHHEFLEVHAMLCPQALWSVSEQPSQGSEDLNPEQILFVQQWGTAGLISLCWYLPFQTIGPLGTQTVGPLVPKLRLMLELFFH
jgi:hypothetical protein